MPVRAARLFPFLVPALVLLALVAVRAQVQKPPVFRAGVDLMQLDVTVLDKTGKPVRGLTLADFTLLEDDKPQAIEGFTAVDLPDVVRTGPAWSRNVTPDVTTNQIDNRRIFVLVLDDARGAGGQLGRREMLKTGEVFIDQLGPQDLAAIVFTQQVRKSQNLTNDRAKLSRALQSYPIMDAGMGATVQLGRGGIGSNGDQVSCLSKKESLKTIEAIVNHLATVPDRRKAVVYYGANLPWAAMPSSDPCGVYWMWRDILTAAQLGHVSINPIDTGLRVNPTEYYMAVAENTGGHAVVGSNDLMPGIQKILVENSSYYLLAYQTTPGDADGTFRRLTVKVNRPDVEVIARRGYWTPRVRPATEPAQTPSPDIEALAGILPSAKLNLRATAAPFAIAGGDGGAIAIALGLTQPAFATRAREVVDVLVKAFTADGDPKGSESAVVPITVPAARPGAEETRYEVLARIDVPKPGRYEVRLSVHSAETDERGSVYLDVDVPDFAKAKLSMSGVVLNNLLAVVPVAPPRLLAAIMPAPSTAEREFSKTDRVTAFLKIYQGGSGRLATVPMRTQIRDAPGATVFDKSESLAPDRFSTDRAADVRFEMPLGRLSAGDHLLTFEATLDKATVRRDVTFVVR